MSEPHCHRRLPARGALLLLVLPLLGLLAPAAMADTAPAAPPTSTPLSNLMPPDPPLRLVVNIPAFRLDVYENDVLLTSYPVTVGKPSDPTPTGRYRLQRVVWNPWWHPPFNRRPKDKVTPPGPRNPMGKVKLYFANLYYLHGTPKEHEIGSPASRGCVRLRNEDVVAVAQLVHRHAMAALPAAKLDELSSTRLWRTQGFPVLAPGVPLDLLYEVVEVRDGELVVYPDFYRQARQPLAELAAAAIERAGYRREQLDPERLAAALAPPAVVPAKATPARPARAKAASNEPLRVPVEQLLLAAEGGAVGAVVAAGVSAQQH